MSFVLGVKTKTTMTLFLIETVFFLKKKIILNALKSSVLGISVGKVES